MTREELIFLLSEKMKLVRTEYNYTQDKMAEILGLSKKTLVQIEKGRNEANWTTVVALVALFPNSDVIRTHLGEDPMETIETMAHTVVNYQREKTLGGLVWWKEIKKADIYRLQQNVVSSHYRILDDKDFRCYSSFNLEEANSRLQELAK